MEDDNTYFKNVVKDAMSDLKNNGYAYVFYQDQVDTIKEQLKKQKGFWENKDLIVKLDDGLYYLTLEKKCDNIK